MGKVRIDQDALVEYLKQEMKEAEEAELRCAEGARYEYAQKFRERKFIFGTILIHIQGGKYSKPFMREDGGFMVEVDENV